MPILKTMLASIAALGLVAAPVGAQAAPSRSASPTTSSEQLAGAPALAWVVLAGFAIALTVLVATSNGEAPQPVSP